MINLKKTLILQLFFALSIVCLPLYGLCAIPKTRVVFTGGLVSIEANGQRLEKILNEIADVLSVKVFLYDDAGNEKVYVSIQDKEPVEALQSVLRNRKYCLLFVDDKTETGVERIYGFEENRSYQIAMSNTSGKGLSGAGGNADSRERSSSRSNTIDRTRGVRSRNSNALETDNNNVAKGYLIDSGNREGLSDVAEEGEGAPHYYSNASGARNEYLESNSFEDYNSSSDDNRSDNEYSQSMQDDESEEKSDEYAYSNEDVSDADDSTVGRLESQIQMIEQQIESGYADKWYDHWVEIRGEKYVEHPEVRLERLENKLAQLAYE
jgi:hypothetical protein